MMGMQPPMAGSHRLGRLRWALALLAIAAFAAMALPGRAHAATAAPPALQQALDRVVADGVWLIRGGRCGR